MSAFASVSVEDIAIGVAIAAVFFAAGWVVRGARPDATAWRGRVPPLVLLALTVTAIAVIAIGDVLQSDDRAQLISALALLGLVFLSWAAGPTQHVATSDLTLEEPGEEIVIEKGQWVPAAIKDHKGVKDRYDEKWFVKEEFELDGETVRKDKELAPATAARDEAKDHVRVERTATRRINYRDITTTTIREGQPVSQEIAEKNPDDVSQHIVFAPGRLVVGKDGRWSTSKLTALLWTAAIAWFLVALVLGTQLLDVDLDDGTFSDLDLPDSYYLLLGGPFAAALLAKTFTTTKVESGSVVKLEKPADTNPISGLQEVLSNDANRNDLVDSQYFLFNLIALGYFLIKAVGGLKAGFPVIPEVLFGLTSAAALTYTAKKGLERDVPLVLSVTPTTVRVGEAVTIYGRNLTPGGGAPDVKIGGRPATSEIVASGDENDRVKATVPDLPAGTVELVVTAGGVPTDARQLTVQTTTITTVAPEPIPVRAGQRIVITGTFGTAEPDVTLGGKPLIVASFSPTTIVAEIAAGTYYPTSGGSAVLEVRAGAEVAARDTKAEALAISDVDPKTIKTDPPARIVVTGRGFASFERLKATLGGGRLDVIGKTDTQLVLRPYADVAYPAGDQRLVISVPDTEYEASADVTVKND
jgi:IPT/TIG domain-containing protein